MGSLHSLEKDPAFDPGMIHVSSSGSGSALQLCPSAFCSVEMHASGQFSLPLALTSTPLPSILSLIFLSQADLANLASLSTPPECQFSNS